MAVLQPIVDMVELCALHGIENAIVCPGSRSAPITLAFVRNPKITCYSIPDERSAGFIALGMAIKTQKPVVVVCTSGSAVYNLAPAVVEAFFQEIPLLIITADRPAEWIHQNDGQTIYQNNIFGDNVKKSFNLIADIKTEDTSWYYQRVVNEAIMNCVFEPAGPVHINIPIREPFYPKNNESYIPSPKLKKIDFVVPKSILTEAEIQSMLGQLQSFERILIAIGQTQFDEELNNTLKKIQEYNIPILSDIISNIRIKHISSHDLFLKPELLDFKPDLLITLGQSFISKSFKKYFQKNKVTAHWHLQNGTKIKDTLQSITKIITVNPVYFFEKFLQYLEKQSVTAYLKPIQKDYFEKINFANTKAEVLKSDFLTAKSEYSDLKAYGICLDNLPLGCDLHLANSMAVRYVNMLGINSQKNIEVFANRGTSGIDGCLSTAIGAAISTKKQTVLMVGDMAFLYDRNAFWNNYLPNNIRIIVFNNAGGNIFRMIEGPASQPELEEYFETKQAFSAKSTILEAGFEYYKAANEAELNAEFNHFFDESDKSKCLEIFTDGSTNQKAFSQFKNGFN